MRAWHFSKTVLDLTQMEAKGLSQELNLNFMFLLPSPRIMVKFGIHNLEGRQDIELAEPLKLPVICY